MSQPGTYVFAVAAPSQPLREETTIAFVREREGTSLVLPRPEAERRGLAFAFEAAWITLTVHSALDAVGLTAAVAGALAERQISCNVVAGFHHDHLFVPVERRDDALVTLRELSKRARA